jgi:hypothetical protein
MRAFGHLAAIWWFLRNSKNIIECECAGEGIKVIKINLEQITTTLKA